MCTLRISGMVVLFKRKFVNNKWESIGRTLIAESLLMSEFNFITTLYSAFREKRVGYGPIKFNTTAGIFIISHIYTTRFGVIMHKISVPFTRFLLKRSAQLRFVIVYYRILAHV